MTGRIIPLEPDRHHEIQALLPWYLAGRLDGEEQASIRLHLSTCAECQAEARSERRLAETISDLPSPPRARGVDQGWRAMNQLIEQEQNRSPRALASRLWASAAARWRGESAWMRWALAVQSCLLVTGAAVLWQATRTPATPPAAYTALGAAPAEADGNVLLMFRPDTTERELRQTLRDSHARLIDGPTAADAYVVRVPAEARTAILAALRGKAQIVLAEPIDAGGPS